MKIKSPPEAESAIRPCHPSKREPAGAEFNEVDSDLHLANILVPLDFSRISRKALDYAVPLARQCGAKITLLHVVEPLPYPEELGYVSPPAGFPMEAVEKQLDGLAARCIEPDLLKETLVRVGSAFEVITNVARECKSDLIVLTTHGYTGFKHVFMGSTAERVVRHAPCPVFVVRRCEHGFK